MVVTPAGALEVEESWADDLAVGHGGLLETSDLVLEVNLALSAVVAGLVGG
jgi:hypothetical protein